MTRRTKFLLGGAGAVLVAAIVVQNLRAQRQPAVEVETEKVALKDLVATVSGSGRVEPKRLVNVSANTMGKVTRIAVREGDAVEKEQFLLEIDPTPYESAVEGAAANLALAEARLREARASMEEARLEMERQQALRQQGFAVEREVERAATAHQVRAAGAQAAEEAVDVARAQLRAARHDLAKVRIHAEMDGVVTSLNVEEGENAVIGTMNNPGTVLLTIADLGVLEAKVRVDETDAVDVRVGQPAEVEIDAYPDTVFAGRVTEVGNSPIFRGDAFSEQAADYEVVVTLDASIPGARPGLSASADIRTAQRDSVLAIPIQAVVLQGRGHVGKDEPAVEAAVAKADSNEKDVEGVFLVENKRAVFRPVRTGIAGETDFEVLEGLREGETVVTGDFKALRNLEDGDRVKVQKAKKESRKRREKND